MTKLRVLGIRAEPPEVTPGEATWLDALVVDPNGPAPAASYLWLACVPLPGQSASACSDLLLSSVPPDCATAPADSSLCVLGSDPAVRYLPPTDLLDNRGGAEEVEVVVSLVVEEGSAGVANCLASLMSEHRPAADCVVAVKRVIVSRRAERNHNPGLSEVLLDGAVLGEDDRPLLAPRSIHTLGGRAFAGAAEPLHVLRSQSESDAGGDGGALDASGASDDASGHGSNEETEDLVLSWFVTAGELAGRRSDFENPDGGVKDISTIDYTTPEVAAPTEVHVYVVIRDQRGGEGWQWRRVRVWNWNTDDGGATDGGARDGVTDGDRDIRTTNTSDDARLAVKRAMLRLAPALREYVRKI